MGLFYAFLAGLTCKAYDDLYDNKLIGNDIITEALKGFQWSLLALLSYNDFNFTLWFYLANVANALSNYESAWNYPYEKSMLLVNPLLLIVSYHTRAYLHIYDWVFICMILSGMFLEPFIGTEEYSYTKLISRVIFEIFFILCIFISPYFNISNSIVKIFYYAIGYLGFSILFQSYAIYTHL